MTIADLYEAFEGKLHRQAVRLMRDSYRADDLVQETFIRAMGHVQLLAQLNPYEQGAWLYRTLRNLFLDEQNARRRQEALIERLAREGPSEDHPPEMGVASDLFELVPERYRELLEMRYVLGMNSQEIGENLGIPAATVRWRLHAAIGKLRAMGSRFL